MKKVDICEVVRTNIRKRMQERDMNNRRLSDITGVSSGFLSDFLGSASKEGRGGIGIERLDDIAHALGVQAFELLLPDPDTAERILMDRAKASKGMPPIPKKSAGGESRH